MNADFKIEKQGNETVLDKYIDKEKNLEIPEGITIIGEYAFGGCESLESVIIPNSVTKIRKGAFRKCEELRMITIPNSVTTIGEYAFMLCQSLTDITIPNSVKTIEKGAFAHCYALRSVTILNDAIKINGTKWIDDIFYSCEHPEYGGLIKAGPSTLHLLSRPGFTYSKPTIKCSKDSSAHKYAEENHIKFELI